MPKTGLRYPSKLTNLKETDLLTVQEIASKLEVAERSVFRWISQGYLIRVKTLGGVNYFTINTIIKPEIEAKRAKLGKYTLEQLEEIHASVLKGERQVAIDIGRFVRGNADRATYQKMLLALDEFREFVQFMIDKT